MGNSEEQQLNELPPVERRALAFVWADRAVRGHASAALERAEHRGGLQALASLPDVSSRRTARKAAWACFTVGVRTSCVLLLRFLTGAGRVKIGTSVQALYALLDAAAAALMSDAARTPAEVRRVGELKQNAAKSAPWRLVKPSAARGSQAVAAGPLATAYAAAEDEARSQREEVCFAHSMLRPGQVQGLANRVELFTS